ncbi:MAG: hypothetical protein LJE90_01980 [Betaproteobacteria bacterium]|jgi:hypothetical protein|nr:hypothetical protein [Betaproteobacteria bacterium]
MQAIRNLTQSDAKADVADVVVRVQTAPDDGERDALERALSVQPGVSRVQIHPGDGALMIVDFDPSAISPVGILRCIAAQGHVGRLLGI